LSLRTGTTTTAVAAAALVTNPCLAASCASLRHSASWSCDVFSLRLAAPCLFVGSNGINQPTGLDRNEPPSTQVG
ncbi:hypothetical protein CCUS01_16624, partial [Colletotrichum cuscutae]